MMKRYLRLDLFFFVLSCAAFSATLWIHSVPSLYMNKFSNEINYLEVAEFILLVILQSLLLKFFVGYLPYKRHIIAGFLMKSLSCLSATIVIIAIGAQYDFFFLRPLSSVIPFLLTILLTEYPIFRKFYGNVFPWNKTALLVLLINVLSFGTLFLSERAYFMIKYDYLVRMAGIEFTHSEILAGEQGHIYAVMMRDRKTEYPLQRYSVETRMWKKMDKIEFPIWPGWNVSRDKLACNHYTRGSVFKLPEFALVGKIDLASYSDKPRLAPSGKEVAYIENVGRVVAQRGRMSSYKFGTKVKIRIYSVETGSLLFDFRENVLDDGFDWSPDSSKIVFVSFRDKGLFAPSREQMKGNRQFGRSGYYPKYLYVRDLKTGVVREIAEGTEPSWSRDGKKILFTKNYVPYVYSLETGSSKRLFDKNISEFIVSCKWSPSGNNIITMTGGKLAVINVADPRKRFIVDEGPFLSFEFYWE